jgi:DNA-binding transcriptional LysR family regulator
LPIAEEALASWNGFRDKVRAKEIVSGWLAIGASGAAKAYLWAAIYNDFGRRYPAVPLDLKPTESTENSFDRASAGELDIALAVHSGSKRNIEWRALGVHEAVLCTSTSHTFARRGPVTAKSLASERFLLFEKPVSIRWLSDELFERLSVTPNIVLESNDVHLIRSMIEVGYGIGFLPDWAIQRELKEKRLRAIKLPGRPLRQQFGLIYNPHSLSTAAKAFIDFCMSHRHLLPATAHLRSTESESRR